MAKKKSAKAYCAVDYAFQRVGGKYKGRILWVLKDGWMRYGELKRAVIGITPKMLTQTLRELEADELVIRKAYAEIPPRVEYALDAAGRELIPFIRKMRMWGERQIEVRGLRLDGNGADDRG